MNEKKPQQTITARRAGAIPNVSQTYNIITTAVAADVLRGVSILQDSAETRIIPRDPPPHEGVAAAFRKNHKRSDATASLTPREHEVLLWAAKGKSAWETAQLLNISEKTVSFYIRNACSRLGVRNKTHAIALCVSHGAFRI